MKRILHLVDSIEYIKTNCFQSQLAYALSRYTPHVVPLSQIHVIKASNYDVVVSCLKQRTLFARCHELAQFIKDTPIIVYDQDPWEAFRNDGPYCGSYDKIREALNVKKFCVTTKWWCDFMHDRGYPSQFVKMWVLPNYCENITPYDQRTIDVGFVGQVHSYRAALFDKLVERGIKIHVIPGGLSYPEFLATLTTIKIFIHNESLSLLCGTTPANINTGLWIKDVEACARGCYSIRNASEGSETYLESIETALLYEDIDDAICLINDVQMLDSAVRQSTIDRTVNFIKNADYWRETAMKLIDGECSNG